MNIFRDFSISKVDIEGVLEQRVEKKYENFVFTISLFLLVVQNGLKRIKNFVSQLESLNNLILY